MKSKPIWMTYHWIRVNGDPWTVNDKALSKFPTCIFKCKWSLNLCGWSPFPDFLMNPSSAKIIFNSSFSIHYLDICEPLQYFCVSSAEKYTDEKIK